MKCVTKPAVTQVGMICSVLCKIKKTLRKGFPFQSILTFLNPQQGVSHFKSYEGLWKHLEEEKQNVLRGITIDDGIDVSR